MLWVTGEREGERDNRLRALRAARPHTVGYIEGGDQEQGEIECATPGRVVVSLFKKQSKVAAQ